MVASPPDAAPFGSSVLSNTPAFAMSTSELVNIVCDLISSVLRRTNINSVPLLSPAYEWQDFVRRPFSSRSAMRGFRLTLFSMQIRMLLAPNVRLTQVILAGLAAHPHFRPRPLRNNSRCHQVRSSWSRITADCIIPRRAATAAALMIPDLHQTHRQTTTISRKYQLPRCWSIFLSLRTHRQL